MKNFRWTHLNERLAYENESRKQRLRQEVMLAKKEANFFIRSYEKGKFREEREEREYKTLLKNSFKEKNKNDWKRRS